MGGDLGDWGDGPPKFEVGGTPMHSPPPNISRSSVIGCVVKYEVTKRKCHEGMFYSEIEVSRQE